MIRVYNKRDYSITVNGQVINPKESKIFPMPYNSYLRRLESNGFIGVSEVKESQLPYNSTPESYSDSSKVQRRSNNKK